MILIDAQYSQKAVFSFERGSYWQNHSSSLLRFSPPPKKSPSAKFPIPPTGGGFISASSPLTAIWKTLRIIPPHPGLTVLKYKSKLYYIDLKHI